MSWSLLHLTKNHSHLQSHLDIKSNFQWAWYRKRHFLEQGLTLCFVLLQMLCPFWHRRSLNVTEPGWKTPPLALPPCSCGLSTETRYTRTTGRRLRLWFGKQPAWHTLLASTDFTYHTQSHADMFIYMLKWKLTIQCCLSLWKLFCLCQKDEETVIY